MPARQTDEDLAERWHDLMGRYHRTCCALDRALSTDHGITVSGFEVLRQLAAGGGCVRMHTLAEHVHLTQSALSRMVSHLEKEALVVRSLCEDDRRSVFVTITPAGLARYRQAEPTHRAILRQQAALG